MYFHGKTILSHSSFFLIFFRCDNKRICDIDVNSGVFGDPCPNTYKYVEIHYACISIHSSNSDLSASTRRLPPWLLEGNTGDLWSSGGGEGDENSDIVNVSGDRGRKPGHPSNRHKVIKVDDDDDDRTPDLDLPPPRKPILVATDVIKHYDDVDNRGKTNQRIPITTPKPKPSTTSKAVALKPINSNHQQTEENPFGRDDESSVAKIALEKENGKTKGKIVSKKKRYFYLLQYCNFVRRNEMTYILCIERELIFVKGESTHLLKT